MANATEMIQMHDVHLAPKPGTQADAMDMRRMGKLQELNRLYTCMTLVGYAVIVGLAWPFALVTGALALTNGGAAGAIWVFLAVAVGMFSVVVSMAEMASIEPTAGGQYHWVSVFVPKKHQKIVSYIVGWMCALGWQSYVPGAANICASSLQALVVVASDSYVPQTWHLVLLTILFCSFAILFNIFLARRLPGIEAGVFTFYVLGFIAFFIILLAMGDRSSPNEIFTHFQDNAGWNSIGTACFVGVSGPVITMIGADSAVHLAEELKDASRSLPKAMITTALVNYALGFAMLVAFISVVGNIDEVLESTTGQAWVQVIWNATQSRTATIIMVAIIIFFYIFCAVNVNTTSSRQLYAFARDGGLPFSNWIRHVSPNRNVPTNAVILTWLIGCGLAVIPLGSSTAFLNIQTIGNAGLLSSYIICIACRIHNRNFGSVYGSLSKPPPFFLGKTRGNVINGLAICFLIVFLVSGAFPVAPNPTPDAMNWSSLALVLTIVVALIAYIPLRKSYLGPNEGGFGSVETVNVQMESKSFDRP
ncbi:hypothetical protein H2201_002521 [Coniosporium apollinis]|uniref:Amino acid permease/ SLC12A domain-containing protein n=1 Tax=Coniosporium apollinis TaxID=61459 RepID=A0ABQ9NY62_9PEZI|nr:hypothetical protein H2201_002521 [Coniosporium apollinis]